MPFSELSPGLLVAAVVGLGLAPFAAVMATSFTKIVVVLSLLRSAIGLQQTPPGVVINVLALVLSLYVMYPVILQSSQAIETNSVHFADDATDLDRLIGSFDVGKEPLRDFLHKHSDAKERKFFYESAKRMLPPGEREKVSEDEFLVVLPAFTVSELVDAFQIGFLIFLPFIVIDLIVASILLALGMMMMPPSLVSLPFKLLLFVLVDGWGKLVHGLVLTY